MNIGNAIRRFERRSDILRWQAWLFLAIVSVLLAFGGYVVFSAASLTARDIRGSDFDQRLESTQKQIDDLRQQVKSSESEIEGVRRDCGDALSRVFNSVNVGPDKELPPTQAQLFGFEYPEIPDIVSIAEAISDTRSKVSGKLVEFRFGIAKCRPKDFRFFIPADRIQETARAIMEVRLPSPSLLNDEDERNTSRLLKKSFREAAGV